MKLHASGEDYLETILVLQKKRGMVRSVDVARHMEVSKPSVCHAVATLRDGGFLTMDEDHFLHLTDVGREVAERIYERDCFFTEQLIAAGGKLQIRERLLLPGLGRLYAEDFSLRAVKPAPKADAAAAGPVAGGLRQTLLPVGEKARIARDTAAFADTAQLLNAAHQTALIIVLGRHKAADCRGCVGCIRRIHRYSPTRRSGHP